MNDKYQEFVDKFKPKLTTDDCYTPECIYRVVLDWVSGRYGVRPENVVRPFFPGGDYQSFAYPPDCVVVDNPPFSIFTPIVRWYASHGIRFFLFAPSLTALGCVANTDNVTLIATGVSVTYDNGAAVDTSFVTNMDNPDVVVMSAPQLRDEIDRTNKKNVKKNKKNIRKLAFPDAIVTGAKMNYLSTHGVDFAVLRSESCFVRALDGCSKGIFGGGLLLSERAAAERAAAERAAAERAAAERAAAERAAAERAAAERISLSVREIAIQKKLNNKR